jgi:hypothetical protein
MSIDYSQSAHPKLSREDSELARRERKAAVKLHERHEKEKVVARDGLHTCRLVPQCRERDKHETAHLDDKGMGGDHGNRTDASVMVRACFFHHQGNWSLHSKDLRVEYLTAEKANGAIAVYGRDESGRWFCVGQESAVGIWARD